MTVLIEYPHIKVVPATDSQLALQKLYVAYFSRPGDTAGIAYWTDALAHGFVTLGDIASKFSTQTEYTENFRNPDGSARTAYQSVNQVYINLFGREAEPAGLAYWGNALENRIITIADVVTAIAAGARAEDLIAIQCKTLASHYFTTGLNSTALQLGYSGSQAMLQGKAFLSSIRDELSLAMAIGKWTWGQEERFSLHVSAPTVVEGDIGEASLTFTVSLDHAPSDTVQFYYRTSDTGQAIVGDDFIGAAGVVTMLPGQTQASVTLRILGDRMLEPTESFDVRFFGHRLVAEVNGTATIVDNDNRAPAFTSAASAQMPENLPPGAVFHTAIASDSNAGDTLVYSLKPIGDAALFSIDPSSGALNFKSSADFEVRTAYTLTVNVRDSGGLSVDQVLKVTVQDVNEAPVITSGESAAPISGNATAGTAVYTIAAYDVDAGTKLSYALGGSDAAYFNVAADGVVTLKYAANFENKTEFHFNVLVSDGQLIDSTAVILNVSPVTSAAPSSDAAAFNGPHFITEAGECDLLLIGFNPSF